EHGDEEHGDEEHGDEEHGDEEHGDEEHGDEEHDDHGDEHGHGHSGADPQVWFDVHNVEKWSANVAEVFSEADPANADAYQANLSAYVEELEALEGEIDSLLEGLPDENRKLVTNHDALGYFAKEYGFEVVGTVLPSLSTNADPSAGELAELIELMEAEGVCTIFGETTASTELAETVAGELGNCEAVQVLTIYTGAIGEGEDGSYIGMFRSNVQTIVEGLK
ncbi:MAG: metal ABC transporter substrate-binding protein, partial [Chloroflexota bacterium]